MYLWIIGFASLHTVILWAHVEESTLTYELKLHPIIKTGKSNSIDPCTYGQKGNTDSLMETRSWSYIKYKKQFQ